MVRHVRPRLLLWIASRTLVAVVQELRARDTHFRLRHYLPKLVTPQCSVTDMPEINSIRYFHKHEFYGLLFQTSHAIIAKVCGYAFLWQFNVASCQSEGFSKLKSEKSLLWIEGFICTCSQAAACFL